MTAGHDGSMSKVRGSPAEALAGLADGATVMFGGFGSVGAPSFLIAALLESGVRDLTVIANDCLEWTGRPSVDQLVGAGQVRRVIASFPVGGSPARRNRTEERYVAGEVALELVPQGTFAERIRAGGAGIAGFYTPTGAGTVVAEGKETRMFNGREHVLELPLTADFALIRAYRADPAGNLVYRGSARNFNPLMAMAGAITVVEVEELVPLGALDPEAVVTPGIFVQRIVVVGRPE
ncbi:MAG: CoA transferase subunit A [Chloroflexi bacterium]|nr:CoA transferase subunit A [Chloroflexota bacterium]